MITRCTVTLMLAAAVCAAGCTAAISTGEGNHADRTEQAAVQQALDASIDSAVVGALIVVDDGYKTWQATAGSAVAGHRQPVDPDSIFRIGSITKAFVATMVLQLVNEGRIALDGSVQQYLPGLLPAGYPPITVRQLLQHTSGIPEFIDQLAGTAGQILDHRFQTYAPEELIGIATARPLRFAPGTDMAYSNTNYLLLGMLIGKITGHRWDDELQQRIAGPLGLTRTRDPGSDPRLPEPHAHGYLTRPDGSLVDITEMNTSGVDAAGSMISSARELNAFFAALLSGKLLSARLVDQMTTPGEKGHLAGGLGDGLGVATLQLPNSCGGQTVYGGAGGIAGYNSLALSTRDGNRRFTVALNTASNDPLAATDKLLRIARSVFCG
jgi:D-alanyl-D-alanine carboxypeptidase